MKVWAVIVSEYPAEAVLVLAIHVFASKHRVVAVPVIDGAKMRSGNKYR